MWRFHYTVSEDFQQERVEIFVVPQKSIDPLEKADEEKSANSISTPASEYSDCRQKLHRTFDACQNYLGSN